MFRKQTRCSPKAVSDSGSRSTPPYLHWVVPWDDSPVLVWLVRSLLGIKPSSPIIPGNSRGTLNLKTAQPLQISFAIDRCHLNPILILGRSE